MPDSSKPIFTIKFDNTNLRYFLVGVGNSPSIFRKGIYNAMLQISEKAHAYYSHVSNWYFTGGSMGREGWRVLSPMTQAERQEFGFNPTSPILVRTGSFKESVVGPRAGPKLKISKQFARSVITTTGHEAGSSIEADNLEVWRAVTDPRFSKLHFGGKTDSGRTVKPRPVLPTKDRMGISSKLDFYEDIVLGFAALGISLDRG